MIALRCALSSGRRPGEYGAGRRKGSISKDPHGHKRGVKKQEKLCARSQTLRTPRGDTRRRTARCVKSHTENAFLGRYCSGARIGSPKSATGKLNAVRNSRLQAQPSRGCGVVGSRRRDRSRLCVDIVPAAVEWRRSQRAARERGGRANPPVKRRLGFAHTAPESRRGHCERGSENRTREWCGFGAGVSASSKSMMKSMNLCALAGLSFAALTEHGW